MKKSVLALAAVSALTVALPAVAQDYGRSYGHGGYDRGGDYGRGEYGRGDYGRGGYGSDVSRQIDRLDARIDRAQAMRQISYREAQRLNWQVDELRRLQRAYWRNDGRINGWESRDLQNRIYRVETSLRFERSDDNGYRGGYHRY
ncbi:MAG: hypothetical protein K1X35_08775 [Caulobacteraceae bacterium]|nr:hypothetical protein [Caulobacteraceae bacterium]